MRIAYSCALGHYVRVDPAIGGDPENANRCPQCALKANEGAHGAYIHSGEAVTILRNAAGEVRIPGSADSPMARRYEQDGFVRETINRHEDIRKLERETGLRHEIGSFDKNSAASDRYYATGTEPPKRTQPVAIIGRDGKPKVIMP